MNHSVLQCEDGLIIWVDGSSFFCFLPSRYSQLMELVRRTSGGWPSVVQSAVDFLAVHQRLLVAAADNADGVEALAWTDADDGDDDDADLLLAELTLLWFQQQQQQQQQQHRQQTDFSKVPTCSRFISIRILTTVVALVEQQLLENGHADEKIDVESPADLHEALLALTSSSSSGGVADLLPTPTPPPPPPLPETAPPQAADHQAAASVEAAAAEVVLPPRSVTTWTVRPSTADERAAYQEQERGRYAQPHKAFTFRQHGYEGIVGPVKGKLSISNVAFGFLILDRQIVSI